MLMIVHGLRSQVLSINQATSSLSEMDNAYQANLENMEKQKKRQQEDINEGSRKRRLVIQEKFDEEFYAFQKV